MVVGKISRKSNKTVPLLPKHGGGKIAQLVDLVTLIAMTPVLVVTVVVQLIHHQVILSLNLC